MVAREDDLQAGGGLGHLVDHRLDAVVRVVVLARALELLREDALGLAEVDVDVAVPLALVVPDDHLADLVLVLRVQGVLLDLAQALPRLLLGALHRDAVEIPRVHLDQQLVADLRLLVQLLGLLEGHLVDGVVEVVLEDDLLAREQRDLGAVVAEAHDGVVAHAELALVRGEEEVLDGAHDQVLGDPPLLDELPDGLRQFRLHGFVLRCYPFVRSAAGPPASPGLRALGVEPVVQPGPPHGARRELPCTLRRAQDERPVAERLDDPADPLALAGGQHPHPAAPEDRVLGRLLQRPLDARRAHLEGDVREALDELEARPDGTGDLGALVDPHPAGPVQHDHHVRHALAPPDRELHEGVSHGGEHGLDLRADGLLDPIGVHPAALLPGRGSMTRAEKKESGPDSLHAQILLQLRRTVNRRRASPRPPGALRQPAARGRTHRAWRRS